MEYKSIAHIEQAIINIKPGSPLIIPQDYICKIFPSSAENPLSFEYPLLDKNKFKVWAEEKFPVEVTLKNTPTNKPDLEIKII